MFRWSMPHRVLAGLTLALMLLISLAGAPAAAQERPHPEAVTHDVLVLVDVTLSMASDQGAGSPWTAVSASLAELLDRLAPGTNVAVVPFDAGPRLSLAYPPVEEAAVPHIALAAETLEALQTHVAGLPVDGQGTHIYESVVFALGELTRWRTETPDVTRMQTLVLYTDGEDTGPHGDAGVVGLAALVDEAQQANASLAVVYHDVAGLLNERDQQLLSAAGIQVGGLDPQPSVVVETASIDLGRVDAGGTVAFELRLSSAFADVFGRRVEASIVGSEGITLTATTSVLSPAMPFAVSFPEGSIPDEPVALVLRSLDADFVMAPHDRVALRFDVSPLPATVDPAANAGPMVTGSPVANELIEAQRARPGVVIEATAAALIGLGVVLSGSVLIRRRGRVASTTFHRLLVRHGAEPNSLLDPETRLIALTLEDLAPRDPGAEDDRQNWRAPDLDLLLQHAALTLRDGELHVRPLNEPLFVGTELVPPAGRSLRTGELLRAGEMHVRYDQCEVK